MVGGEIPFLKGNERPEKQGLNESHCDRVNEKLQEAGNPAAGTDQTSMPVPGNNADAITPARAMQAFNRLAEALDNPEQSRLLNQLIQESEGVFLRPLLAGLNPPGNPEQERQQNELFLTIKNAFSDST